MYLFACAHGEFFECSDVIYQQVHQAEFVAESNQDV